MTGGHMSFDLTQISDAPSAEFAVLHPITKEPIGVTLTLAGPEHQARKKLRIEHQRRVRARIQKAGKLVLDDPESDAAAQVDVLVASTLGWKGLQRDGVEVAFSESAARELYEDKRLAWLREQVLNALDERELFIQTSGAA